MTPTTTLYLDSPLGVLAISGTDAGISAIRFLDDPPPEHDAGADVLAVLQQCADELRAYFAGDLREFSVPVDAPGTEFQRRVWAALRDIPFGETRAYSDIARALGDDNTVRAVGAANGQNPVAIVVPCHRVVGRDGALTGYAGGLWRKEWLLAHEGRPVQRRLFA
jgi:methylated-DNA-[protein]-cysteine S-methyltransferase